LLIKYINSFFTKLFYKIKVATTNQSRTEILIDQLKKNKCECMVCYQVVKPEKPIWSCNICFHIFHMACIKKWSQSPAAKVDEVNSDKWRCPCCQTIFEATPNRYTCFCGKKLNPNQNDPTNATNTGKQFHNNLKQLPHSCGDICSKQLSFSNKFWLNQQSNSADSGVTTAPNEFECKHTCVQLCHPGPCASCETIVTRSCQCGKSKFQVKCNSTKKPVCTEKCDRMLNCGLHSCGVECHGGECEPCQVEVQQECHSHKLVRQVKCGTNGFESEFFSCDEKCLKMLSCGNHQCQDKCHSGKYFSQFIAPSPKIINILSFFISCVFFCFFLILFISSKKVVFSFQKLLV
jgi:transcriptional repressor NF-X1